MKFWHKILTAILLLFIIALDISVITIMTKNWKLNLEKEFERAKSEQILIANNILENLTFINKRGGKINEEVYYDIGLSYSNYYKKQGILIELWIDSKVLFSSSKGISKNIDIQGIQKHKNDDSYYIQISSVLPEPFENITLVYLRNIDFIYETQSELNNYFIIINFVMGIFLIIILYFIVRYLAKPLDDLTETTKLIADGNYSQRVYVKSKDEFGILAEHFNIMTEAIENHMNKVTELANEKQLLVDNLSHELRTPLTSMQGFADFLVYANISDEERLIAANYIKSESQRLSQLSKKLLNISDVQNISWTMEDINLEELFVKLKGIEEPQLKDANINLIINCESETVKGDFDLLLSLFINLVDNSIHASKSGNKIQINSINKGNKVIIEVIDEGFGMDQREINKVFEAFYRVDKSRSREHGGAGLGLTLCKQIIEAHKGKLNIHSEKNKGTKIILQLFNKFNDSL